jgi:hypothetical protein
MTIRRYAMFDRSKKARLETHRSTRRVVGAAVLTLFLAIFMMSMAGESKACPPGMISTKASLSHKLKSKAFTESKIVVATALSASKVDRVRGLGRCCGGAPHSSNSGCSHACCSSGAVALLDAGLIVAIRRISSGYVLPQGDQVTLANPGPDFRPPRLG